MFDTYTEEFVAQYIHTMLWQADGQDGLLSQDFTTDDFSADALTEMRDDCKAFLASETVSTILTELAESKEYDAGAAGHDFALTRNRHGAGFWDRGLGAHGRTLTELAHTFQEQDIYVADSGYLEIQ